MAPKGYLKFPWRLHICILRKVRFMAYSRQKPLKMYGWFIS